MNSTQIARDEYLNATIHLFGSIRVTRTDHCIGIGSVDNWMAPAFSASCRAGFYDVVCYDAQVSDALIVNVSGVEMTLTAEQLASVILAQPDYTGQPVRLLCCWVRQHDDGFVHQLDRLLGHAGVLACTNEAKVGAVRIRPNIELNWRLYQSGQVKAV